MTTTTRTATLILALLAGCSSGTATETTTTTQPGTRGPLPDDAGAGAPDTGVQPAGTGGQPGTGGQIGTGGTAPGAGGQLATVDAQAPDLVPDPIDQMGNLLPPVGAVTPPPGCVPGAGDAHGIGHVCTDGGGECGVKYDSAGHLVHNAPGDGAIPLSCTCDSLTYTPPTSGTDGPVTLHVAPGTPCMCIGRNGVGHAPAPAWTCPGPAPDPIAASYNFPNTATVSYTYRVSPASWFSACVPAACAGLDLSR